jgi:hypothetical protein
MDRRNALAWMAAAGSPVNRVAASVSRSVPTVGTAWIDVCRDFGAKATGTHDDTDALQSAIRAGASGVRPVFLPPGAYMITRPLHAPPNTMLFGSALGAGFGCRLEPHGCAAIAVGGKDPSFHCSFENLLIWPRGPAPDCIVSVDNSYSVQFRNIRIHECQAKMGRAAVLLLGAGDSGGHGSSANVIWDNLIVRNDTVQPNVAVHATAGCGTHRFFSPDLENYAVLLEWQGGQLDLIAPYCERAGRYAVNCQLASGDATAYLNTIGGRIEPAASGVGCAIWSTTHHLCSFGTCWSSTARYAAYCYEVPDGPVSFNGSRPNLSGSGLGQFAGVPGWRSRVQLMEEMPAQVYPVSLRINPRATERVRVPFPGARQNECVARVYSTMDTSNTHISAFVEQDHVVAVVLRNITEAVVTLQGSLFVDCRIVPGR